MISASFEQALIDALPGDTTLWSQYLADDWYIITEDGTGYTRSQFLQTFHPFPRGFAGHLYVINPVFTFHDQIAIIHYVVDEYETVYGQKLHTSYAATDTWYRHDTSWKMIGSQVFEVPQLPPAVKLESQVLRNYTGTYVMADNNRIVISLQGDTLYMQKNKNKPVPLYAETVNVFFQKGDSRRRKIFEKNEKGDVFLLERRNGTDIKWKRDKKG